MSGICLQANWSVCSFGIDEMSLTLPLKLSALFEFPTSLLICVFSTVRYGQRLPLGRRSV